MLDVGEGGFLGLEQRRQLSVVLFVHDQANKLVDDVSLNVTAVVAGNKDLALHVQDVDPGENHGQAGRRLWSPELGFSKHKI